MSIGGMIDAALRAAAGAVSGAPDTKKVEATCTRNESGGWTIEAGDVTETVGPGGRVTIGDTVFLCGSDGSLWVEQDGKRPVQHAGPEDQAPPSASTTTTTTTSPPTASEDDVVVSVEVPSTGQTTQGTSPIDPESVSEGPSGTSPIDPESVSEGPSGTSPIDPRNKAF